MATVRSRDDDDRLIPGTGPVPAEIALIGEAGGRTEHYRRRPFCGKAGEVLTAYIRAAGLSRSELWISNIYPFWPGEGNPDPTEEQIKQEEWRLVADLERVKPRVIGAVGRVAARWFLGDVDIETAHGRPFASDRVPGATVVVCTHPAAGFYEPERAAWSQDDFLRLAYYAANPVEIQAVPELEVILVDEAPKEIRDAAVDTEWLGDGTPWGMSWSTDGRTCYVWLWAPGRHPPRLAGHILFHNAIPDLDKLRRMGIDTRSFAYGDTMLKLFNLQLEPQSLKSASYRHLGLKMTTYDETVRPHFDKVAVEWLKEAAEHKYKKPKELAVEDFAKKKWRIYRQQDVGRRMKNTIKAWEKDQALIAAGTIPDKPVKLEKRWAEIGLSDWADRTLEYQGAAERAVGRSFPDFALTAVPLEQAVKYSGTDAGATWLVDRPLDGLLEARGLEAVYEMDRRALPFVDRMQEVGMRVDVEKLKEFEADLEVLREKAAKKVRRIVGNRWFNPGSSQQVAGWLYSYRGLPVLTYTDTGQGSTSDAALQMLRGYHAQDPDVAEFLTCIQDYRETDKYLGTHVALIFDALKRDSVGDWRIHADFRTTRVVSGRLSSWLLTIPVRTDLGRRFRHCFVARDGWIVVDADLSQLELRVGAHYSRDRRMRDAFERGEDLHALTASIIFKKPLSSIDKEGAERYIAKTINFAVFYGISAKALLEQLYKAFIFDFTLQDCERFIAEWFRIFGSVRAWQHRLWAQAAKDGFVRTLWGRICYIPNLRVVDEHLREAAQRLASNFPVQGTGSDTTKRAEIRLHEVIEAEGLREEVWPWLQMHDELVLEVKKERAEEVARLLEVVMTADQRKFSVPIKASAKMGKSWGEAKG